MLNDQRIPFPLRGLSDGRAYQDQTPDTTQHTLNMRGRDPVSGRLRGSQRSGLTKVVSPLIGSDFVQDLIGVPYDIDLSTKTVRESAPAIEWSQANGSDSKTPAFAGTPGGDRYIISGTGTIEKYNANGDLVLSAQLPLTNSSEYATAIVVGSDSSVYVSTTITGSDDTIYQGKVFCYQPSINADDQLDLYWTYNAQGRVPDIAFSLGSLFVIVNNNGNSELRSLGSLGSLEPALLWDRPIPNPSSKLAVNMSGEILVSSEPNEARDDVVIGAFCGTQTVDWTPNDLGVGELYCWLDAGWIPDKAELETVDFWLDRSGNNRNAVKDGIELGGKFVGNALCGLPGVRFDGKIVDGKKPGLQSLEDGLKWLPNNNDQRIITMMLVSRSPALGDSTEDGLGKIIEDGGQPYFTLWQRQNGLQFNIQQTYPGLRDNTGDSGTDIDEPGTGVTPEITNDGRVAIITWAIDPNGDREGSFFRVNGKTYTQVTHQTVGVGGVARFAYTQYGGAMANFDLLEMVVATVDYDWPSDYETVPSGTGSGQSGVVYTSSGAPVAWSGEPSSGAPVSDIEKIEGYLAHKAGVQSILDSGHPYYATAPGGGSSGSSSGGGGTNADIETLKSPYGIVSKYGAAQGQLRWAYSDAGVGHGLAVGVDEDDDGVYTTGPTITLPSGSSSGDFETTTTRRRLVDQGFTVSDQSADGAWAGTEAMMYSVGVEQRIFVDSDQNVYIPHADGSNYLSKINAAGAIEWTYDGIDEALGYAVNGIVAASDTVGTDLSDSIGEPEFMYFGATVNEDGTGKHTFFKLRLVDIEVAVGAPRGMRYIAVCEGNIRKLDPELDTVSTVTNGTGALNANSRIVRSVAASGQVFFIDGDGYKYYDPVTDTVEDWQPTGAGSMPNGARIIEHWRGRILLARVQNEASNIYASKLGDPFGWDRSPPVLSATQAFSLAASQAGKVPDIVNSLIPYNDDLLIIGCNSSIWMLHGDPMNAVLDPKRGTYSSGELRQVSDTVGMAFGRAWCRDPEGRVYFLSSQGGIYSMVPGQLPVEISGEIRRRLEQIDLEYFTVRLAWNQSDNGLHVFFVPVDVVPSAGGSSSGASSSGASSGSSSGSSSGASSGGGSGSGSGAGSGFSGPDAGSGITPVDQDPAGQAELGEALYHFFWERDTNAWWQDQLGSVNFDPTCVAVFDGDKASDRRVVMGCADGYVRGWDEDAVNDDGSAINAYVRVGPVMPSDVLGQYRFTGFTITLASEQDGATLNLRRGSSETAQPIGDVWASKTLVAGRSDEWKKKIRGESVFLDLVNQEADERFSVESMACSVARAGRVR